MGRVDEAPSLVDACLIEQPRDGPLTTPGETILDFPPLLRRVDMKRRQWAERLRALLAGHDSIRPDGAQRVRRHADCTERIAPRPLSGCLHDRAVLVEGRAEMALACARRQTPEAALLVQHREERHGDAARASARQHGVAHRHRVVIVEAAVASFVEVMEFRDRGEASLQHFHRELGGDGGDIRWREPRDEVVHGGAPCPEIVGGGAGALREPDDGALEGMRMEVGRAGNDEPSERQISRLDATRRGGDDHAAGIDLDDDVRHEATRQPGLLEIEAARGPWCGVHCETIRFGRAGSNALQPGGAMQFVSVQRGEAPLVISLPHTGTDFSPGILSDLVSEERALVDTDWRIDQLYAFAAGMGATLVRTRLSRTVIDVNRDPSGASLYPGQATTGLCPTETFDGEPLYRPGREPDAAEIEQRKRSYFEPFHAALGAELDRLGDLHGAVALYDCHSIRSRVPRLFDGELPVFNIGANDGAACHPALRDLVAERCARADGTVVVDGRFKGGWITRRYGRPEQGVHAVQMELAQRFYMDEDAPHAPNALKAAHAETILREVLAGVLEWVSR